MAQKKEESEQQATPRAAAGHGSEPRPRARPQQGVRRLSAQGADGSFCPGVNGSLHTAVDLTSAHHRS